MGFLGPSDESTLKETSREKKGRTRPEEGV